MSQTTQNALIIFVKNPELGKVKTRLAATTGPEKALAIYRSLMRHTRQIAESLAVNRLLFYSQYIPETDDWSTKKFHKELQVEADLGTKMASAFHHAFRTNQRVLIIGSDCAALTAELVAEAFQQLETNDFVVGPARDGGYYLLGMNQFQPTLFQDIAWSTAEVFPTTLKRIKDLNATYHLLPVLSDIDYEADWQRDGWDLPGYPKNPSNKYNAAVIPPQTKA